MNDLSEATGMAKPGLYATFGDKAAIYSKSLAHYFEEGGRKLLEDVRQSPDPTPEVIRRFLERVAESVVNGEHPGGCFLVGSVMECAHQDAALKALGLQFSEERRAIIVERFRDAKSRGEFPESMSPEAIGEFISGQTLALGVMGRAGTNLETLKRFIDVAMTALPVAQE